MVGFLAVFDYNKQAGIGLLHVDDNSAISEREYRELTNGTNKPQKIREIRLLA
jgi:hypothetical protein